jgi:predicted transposase YdaD
MGTLANKWLKEGEDKGIIIGEARGEARGEIRGKVIGILAGKKDTAIAMLQEGMDIKLVSKITKLSIKEIKDLKN